MITNTEEEDRGNKAINEETAATISSSRTLSPHPILSRMKERQNADSDENDYSLEHLLENKNKRKRAPVCDGTAKSSESIVDQVNGVDEDIISDARNIQFNILKPKLEKYSVKELMKIEKDNPDLIKHTGYLWIKFVEKNFGDSDIKVHN